MKQCVLVSSPGIKSQGLARAANIGIHIGTAGRDVIEGLRTAVLHHAGKVAGVMTADTARWSH